VRGERIFLLVYVDDLLIAAKNLWAVSQVKERLKKAFDIRDLGEAWMFLGFQIERNREERSIKVSQKCLALDLVEKYGMGDSNPRKVPLSHGTVLSMAGEPLNVKEFPYGELIGSLLYLMVGTRPDLSFSVGALSRYMSKPMVEHWQAAKGILRYIAGTAGYGIVYSAKSASATLQGYCDSDYAGCIDTRKSTTGYVFLIRSGAVSWSSRVQPTVATSTAEAEYMSCGSAVKEALWLCHLARALQLRVFKVPMWCDNQAAIRFVGNPITSAQAKHIDVLYHFVRERMARGEVSFAYCKSEEMVADCLTKALPLPQFEKFVRAMGVS